MQDFPYNLPLPPLLLFCLAVAAAFAALIHFGLKMGPGPRLAERSSGIAPVMQSIVAVFAALSVTFLSNTVWRAEDLAREAVATEARNLHLVVTYSRQMPEATGAAILANGAAYAAAVAGPEWGSMVDEGAHPDAEAALRSLYASAVLLAPSDTMRGPLLSALDRLSFARDARLAQAQDAVSPTQWTVVLVLMLLLLAVVAICHGRDARARAIALAFSAAAIGISLFGILAHDQPFIGHLAITAKPVLQAAASNPPG